VRSWFASLTEQTSGLPELRIDRREADRTPAIV
jgi:hypothetical protein